MEYTFFQLNISSVYLRLNNEKELYDIVIKFCM